MPKIPVAILGGTGIVGQRFVSFLADHPFFELVSISASEARVGKPYGPQVPWSIDRPLPESAAGIKMDRMDAKVLVDKGARAVFSAIPSEVATDLEHRIADAGLAVFSNAKTNRMHELVPLMIPEVNADHLAIIEQQRKAANRAGFIVTNPNCTATGLVMGLKPAMGLGIRRVTVTSYQALSGAGYPGVASLDITANVIPFIDGEEGKVARETQKMLGRYKDGKIHPFGVEVLASCSRVGSRDGHLEAVWIEVDDPDPEKFIAAVRRFKGIPQEKGLPTAPENPTVYLEQPDRPQPLRDVNLGTPDRARGMTVAIGRARQQGHHLGFYLLVNNTVRGAAGGSVLNAELAQAQGFLR